MPLNPVERSVLHTEVSAEPTRTPEGGPSVVVSLRYKNAHCSSGSRAHLDLDTGWELYHQLGQALRNWE